MCKSIAVDVVKIVNVDCVLPPNVAHQTTVGSRKVLTEPEIRKRKGRDQCIRIVAIYLLPSV